ncbi:MAG: rRNA maturation RNase YbeY [Deltaproteobacteria bacterium]|jgi:probable rRNA maturation factor|nr:rRNA maturation RNase YbeY [Deltaproteobacteria bacterium]MBT4527677.1 rRNA maturation RNase YbeY [Deltaproteobacteria bacterium]
MSKVFIQYSDNVNAFAEPREKKIIVCINTIADLLNEASKSVNLLICDQETIKNLNSQYRNKNQTTDILSWAYDESEMIQIPGEPEIWGDLALCLDVCVKQAQASRWDIETELIRLLVHGLSHLAGYDHQTPEDEKKMLRLETELLSKIGFDDIYNPVE